MHDLLYSLCTQAHKLQGEVAQQGAQAADSHVFTTEDSLLGEHC